MTDKSDIGLHEADAEKIKNKIKLKSYINMQSWVFCFCLHSPINLNGSAVRDQCFSIIAVAYHK